MEEVEEARRACAERKEQEERMPDMQRAENQLYPRGGQHEQQKASKSKRREERGERREERGGQARASAT